MSANTEPSHCEQEGLIEDLDEEGCSLLDDHSGLSSMSAAQYRRMLEEEAELRPVPIASVFWDQVRNPLSDEPDPTFERRREIVELLRAAFATSGIELKACRAERIQISELARRLLDIDDDKSRYYRDRGDGKVGRRDTVSSALDDLRSALGDCILCSQDVPPLGQLNISSELIRELQSGMPEWRRREVHWPTLRRQRSAMPALQSIDLFASDCSRLIQRALSLGVEKPEKKPRNLLYSSFIVDLAEICRLGHVDIYDRDRMPGAIFLDLVERCEAILPAASRCATDKRKRRRRVNSALTAI